MAKIKIFIIIILLLTSCNLPQTNDHIGCSVDELIEAINEANSTPNTEDTINLAPDCTYELTNPSDSGYVIGMRNGLPMITSPIKIYGNNSVITRLADASSDLFRYFYIAPEGSLILNDLNFTEEDIGPDGAGGGIMNIRGELSIHNSTFMNNYSPIYNYRGELSINNSTFLNNYESIVNYGFLTITDSTFNQNETPIKSYRSLLITDSIFHDNSGCYGGAIVITLDSGGIATISDSVFTDNGCPDPTSGRGGAIFSLSQNATAPYDDKKVIISGCTFTGNRAREGGAILNLEYTKMIINNSSFFMNSAHSGGAINNYHKLEISSSTINDNNAPSGGGIYSKNRNPEPRNSSLLVTNCTFSGNTNYDDATHTINPFSGGGAIAIFDSGIYGNNDNKIAYSTITEHSEGPQNGGAVLARAGCSVEISNSIIAGNSIGDCTQQYASSLDDGVITASGFNLDSDGSCPDFKITADPKLEPLADNGGGTLTHALKYDSPAIDSALSDCPPTDQRNISRPFGSSCDLGSFEYSLKGPEIPSPDDPSISIPIIIDLTLCWEGPGPAYDGISSLQPGTPIEVLGIGQGGGYIVVNNPRYNRPCWVEDDVINLNGLNISTLPVYEIPPVTSSEKKPEIKEPDISSPTGCLVTKNLSEAPKCVVPCPDPEKYPTTCEP